MFRVIAVALLFLNCAATGSQAKTRDEVTTMQIHLPKSANALTKRVAGILSGRIKEYSGARTVASLDAQLHIYLDIKSGIGSEGFKISDRPDGGVSITGNDQRGLLYGVGKFLHTSTYSDKKFTPSRWRGVSVPSKPVRGMYLATHLLNYYDQAPIEDVRRYVEDLSLWGINSYLVWFAIDEFNGIDDPRAQVVLNRLRALLKTAKDLGLNVSLGCVANDGYKNSPVELRADSTVGHDGYRTENGNLCTLGPELCPSKPGVPEMEVKYCEEKFAEFKSIGLDYWFIAPYDNGGCTCSKCAPWGTNGYLRMAELEARAYRRAFPKGKVILSLWFFDRWIDGEWAGITEKFNKHKPDWVDYVMVDDFGGKYPQYPLTHGTPGGLPMLNFPEISMYGQSPWGGYGANPLPKYLQSLWDVTKTKVSGGFPYSEGMYEDINKIICAQLYWDPDKPTKETVREYIAFNFSPDVVDGVSKAIDILERNLQRSREDKDGVTKCIMQSTEGAEEAYRLICEADAKLPSRVRSSWRWEIVYLRAMIDSELAKHQFRVSDKCAAAFAKLTTIYYQDKVNGPLTPPRNLLGIVKSVE